MMFDNIRTVYFERVNENVVRMIAFDTCELTGAKSVADIYESGDYDKAHKFLARRAADYTNHSKTDVDYFANVCGDRIPMEQFDLGRARKLESKLVKLIAQVLDKK